MGLTAAMPALADGAPGRHLHQVNWHRRDTAIYVVSTLNLVRTGGGQTLAAAVQRQLSVVRFNVYADQELRDLYFIALQRSDGTTAGALAYQMGWARPQSVTPQLNALGVAQAPNAFVQAYKTDTMALFGSFSSTLPH